MVGSRSIQHRKHSEALPKSRVMVLGFFIFAGFSLLAARFFVLQVSTGEILSAQAASQHRQSTKVLAERGDIYITQGGLPTLAATNREQIVVFAVPKEVVDVNGAAAQLALLLSVDEMELKTKLSDTSRSYVVLARDVNQKVWSQVEALGLPGIRREEEVARYYPQGKLLSHVLGFVGYRGDEKAGLYGLESKYEDELSGASSGKTLFGIAGLFAGSQSLKATSQGGSLFLTIDQAVQFKSETLLHETVQKHGADGGCVVVLDAKTGAVLAMASNPEFDPNSYGEAASSSWYNNLCTTGAYEPGSVFKPITMAASLEEGKITPTTEYEDTGAVEVGGYTIRNAEDKVYGRQNMQEVLEHSINTGVIFAKDQIGNKTFRSYLEKFQFGKKTGIEVQESAGSIAGLEGNNMVNYHTASFGQGILVTPLQLARAYTAFTNQGNMLQPYLVERLVMPEGEVKDTIRQEPVHVLGPRAADDITTMLIGVVENGHGKRAGVPGYYVAGKTGTAQVAKKDGPGYEADVNIGTFAGYAPARDPKFVAVVRVDHPRDVLFAESTAAPAFGELAKFLLTYYKIPPERK